MVKISSSSNIKLDPIKIGFLAPYRSSKRPPNGAKNAPAKPAGKTTNPAIKAESPLTN